MSGELMHETLPTSPPGMPATDLDLWSDEVLADPYPAYRQLRDIGPVVWLNRYGIAAFPRFARGAHRSGPLAGLHVGPGGELGTDGERRAPASHHQH